jgi:CheY-like chemotaxis protein
VPDSFTILVVDDEVDSLSLLNRILGAEGYQVRSADRGRLALASVAQWLPELILLDIACQTWTDSKCTVGSLGTLVPLSTSRI